MRAITGNEVVVPARMSDAERRSLADALYAVHCEIFDGVDRDAFVKYVIESKAEQTKILLETDASARVVAKTPMRVVHVPPMAAATAGAAAAPP